MHKNIPPNDDKAGILNKNTPKPDIMPAGACHHFSDVSQFNVRLFYQFTYL
jgi:hypothetical protein